MRDPPSGPNVLNDRPIAFLRPGARESAVSDHATLQGFVLMMVRGHEPRHDDRAGAVDHERIGGRDVRRDRCDQLPVNKDIGALKVAHLRVEAEHDAASQQDAAPAVVTDQVLRICGCCGAQPGKLRRGKRGSSQTRRGGGNELAARRIPGHGSASLTDGKVQTARYRTLKRG